MQSSSPPLFASTFILLTLSACVSYPAYNLNELEYECDDVVAIGRVKSASYTDLSTQYDVFGRGRYDLEIRLKQVLYGDEKNTIVRAYYEAHGQLSDEYNFLFVLSPRVDGYYVAEADVWHGKSTGALSDSCR